MPADIRELEEWERSVKLAAERSFASRINISVSPKHTHSPVERLRQFLDSDKLADVIREFIQEKVVGPSGLFGKGFYDEAGPAFYPKAAPDQGSTFDDLHDETEGDLTNGDMNDYEAQQHFDQLAKDEADRVEKANKRSQKRTAATEYGLGMQAGFDKLRALLTQFDVVKEGTSYVVTIGNMQEIMALKLSDYMRIKGIPVSPDSPNSLFYAVEFGTGIEANVGPFVRYEGPTKDQSGDGSWWVGAAESHNLTGIHTQGQKGFHFLYDEQTRAPLDMYREIIEGQLPLAIRSAIRKFRPAE